MSDYNEKQADKKSFVPYRVKMDFAMAVTGNSTDCVRQGARCAGGSAC